ncbi:MAG TPA: phage holin family protein [Chthoniobacterales bacterium]|nr:phage holin family protein [Chthoniobacterales bacterium]
MRHFIFRWFITAFAVFVAANVVGFGYTGLGCLLGASLLLGIVNAFVRPILLFLSIPFILVTLGFFILIVNALMLKLVSEIVPCFQVHGFWRAIFGAIIISLVSWLLSAFFRGSDGRVHVLTHHSQIKQVQGRVIEPGE